MSATTGKIDLYYFGDIGAWDDLNPYYWYRKPSSPEILFAVAGSSPYELNINDIAGIIDRKPEAVRRQISAMAGIGMLSEKEGKYSTSFSVVLERDVPILRELAERTACSLSEVLLDHGEELKALAENISCSEEFGTARVLYHAIGCDTLDGTALEALADMGIMAISKEQPGGRNYILQGFERSATVEEMSSGLLCSCNSTGNHQVQFISFGDTKGDRKDLFRFLRMKDQLGPSEACRQLNLSPNPIMENPEEHILELCSSIILKAPSADTLASERHAAAFLQELEYISVDSTVSVALKVPFFRTQDRDAITAISERVMELMVPILEVEFANLPDKLPGLSSLDHVVDGKEIANELWHQVFGRINEELVRDGLLAKPKHILGEGRYFRALYASGI